MSTTAEAPELTLLKAGLTGGSLVRKGPRVTLRPHRGDDVDAVFDGIADFDVVKNLSRAPWPYAREDAAGFLAGRAKGRAEGKDYSFAIEVDGALVGGVGLHAREGLPELGYWLAKGHWGKGYATEAATLAVVFGAAELGLSAIEAGYFEDNPASGRVLRKLGFEDTGVEARYSLARQTDVACRLLVLREARITSLVQASNGGGPGHGG